MKRFIAPFFASLPVPLVVAALLLALPAQGWSLASNNIPLDSPVYEYLDKLAGFGIITEDVKGVRPFSKAEAARLVLEAQEKLPQMESAERGLAEEILSCLKPYLRRELELKQGGSAPLFDFNRTPSAKLRYVYLDGAPRDYTRMVYDPANQSAFGFIGGNLRPQKPALVRKSGTEGTPLVENNEGVNYSNGSTLEARIALEGYLTGHVSLLAEPDFMASSDGGRAFLRKGYLKVGGGGLELEAGRDANWFGPGYRGSLTLTDNAHNFDLIKISSPEPLDFDWVKEHLGQLKYAVIISRFDESGSGDERRQPYFFGAKLSLRATSWFEIGATLVRQEGGPGLGESKTTFQDFLFGGGYTNKSNSIGGIDLRFRIPQLRNTELYAEYVGEDSALFWPFIESYVAGIYVPRLTASGRDDLRIEYFWGHPILYSDGKFPDGYTNRGMSVGHPEGGGSQEIFARYGHWFSARTRGALEYFYTDRGRTGKVGTQVLEEKHAGRARYTTPVWRDLDLDLMYGLEHITNLNLENDRTRTNQVLKMDLNYRY